MKCGTLLCIMILVIMKLKDHIESNLSDDLKSEKES